MDLNGLPQTVQNFINDTIQYRESGNCLDYDTCQKILEYAADTGSQKLTGLGLYYLAECYWQKGEYENTMQCLTEGVGCLENARMYELLAKAHNMMGAVSDRKNNRMLALSSYYNSLKYAEKYHFEYVTEDTIRENQGKDVVYVVNYELIDLFDEEEYDITSFYNNYYVVEPYTKEKVE